uniref:Uncharacterized protein n=1 Tax=Cacopsylla melanoneura TaxID=428564 RepID=A0A8D8U2C9_9HEMI
MLSLHLSFGLPLDRFPSTSSVIAMNGVLVSSILATCPAYFNLLAFNTCMIFGALYLSSNSLFFKLRHSPVLESITGPNILRNTFLSNTRNLLSSALLTVKITSNNLKCQNPFNLTFLQQGILNVLSPPYVPYTVIVHFKQTRTMFKIHPIFNLITLMKVLSSPYLPYILQQGILITLNKLKCQNLFNPTFLQQGILITLKMKQTIG